MTFTQLKYFDILKNWLGENWKQFIASNEEPHDFASSYCHWYFNLSKLNDHNLRIDKLKELISKYWNDHSDTTISYVRKNGSNKVNYFGDISPLPEEHLTYKALSLSDAILIPCAVQKILNIAPKMDSRTVFFMLLKHSLQMLQIENLTQLQEEIPLAIVVPNICFYDKNYSTTMVESSLNATIQTVNNLYDENFETFNDIKQFSKKFSSDLEMARAAKKNIIYWEPGIKDGDLENYYDQYKQEVLHHETIKNEHAILDLILGKRTQSADALYITSFWGSSPITDNEASHLSLVDYLKNSSPTPDCNQFVDQIFQKAKVPFLEFTESTFLKLRENNEINKLRDAISQEIKTLDQQDLFAFERAAHRVEIRLKHEYEEYKQAIDSMQKEYTKDSLINLCGITTFGAITISCAMWPAFLNIAGISGIIGTSNFLKSLTDAYSYREKMKEIKLGFIAILCKKCA